MIWLHIIAIGVMAAFTVVAAEKKELGFTLLFFAAGMVNALAIIFS